MIYTITFNPALDYIAHVSGFTAGALNRTEAETVIPGGKGINVSVILSRLGQETEALGFTAGFTGTALGEALSGMGIRTDFIRVKNGLTRINVKLKSPGENGIVETEINGRGPEIAEEDLEKLFEKTRRMREGDTLVLSGSVPPNLPDTIYEDILKSVGGRGIRCVVDAEGLLLVRALAFRPFLVKPNLKELGEICGTEIRTVEEAALCAGRLRSAGAENVLVSMGRDGAYLASSDGKSYRAFAPSGKTVNSVGAGDSMVAGFLAGYDLSGGDALKALKMGTAAGSATAFAEGLAERDGICECLKKTEGSETPCIS